MTWNEYNQAIGPLVKCPAFSYSTEEIRKGYYRWQREPQAELKKFIDISLSTGLKLDLTQPIYHKNDNHPSREVWKSEPKIITDGFLDNLLKENDASTLLDLVFNRPSHY